MRFLFAPGFVRGLKRHPPPEKIEIQRRVDGLIRALDARSVPPGFGLKKLRGSVWEIRVGLGTRVLFDWRHELIVFLLVGNHNEVARFLKHYQG